MMMDSRRFVRSRWGQLLAIFFPSFLASLFICWLFATPSRSAIFQPPETWPDYRYQFFSVVIPTYKEAESLKRTISALRRTKLGPHEIIIVDDDSQDDTAKVVHQYQTLDGMDIKLRIRHGETGLSSAVMEGMRQAQGEIVVVMDADGQHPPKAVLNMLRIMSAVPTAQMALGTRGNVATAGWPWYRRLMSWGATGLAKPLLRMAGGKATVAAAHDPMTGFFAVRADVVRRARPLNASGFKIALELLVKSVLVPENFEDPIDQRVIAFPYEFQTRTVGTSKLGATVVLQYALQVFSLYYFVLGIKLPLLLALPLALAYYVATGFLAWYARCRGRRRYDRVGSPTTLSSNGDRNLENGKEHSA